MPVTIIICGGIYDRLRRPDGSPNASVSYYRGGSAGIRRTLTGHSGGLVLLSHGLIIGLVLQKGVATSGTGVAISRDWSCWTLVCGTGNI